MSMILLGIVSCGKSQQSNMIRNPNPKLLIGTASRAELSFYQGEGNGQFTTDFQDLGVAMEPKSKGYKVSLQPIGDLTKGIAIIAEAKNRKATSYVGIVSAEHFQVSNDPNQAMKLCRAVGKVEVAKIALNSQEALTCPSNSQEL